MSRVPVTFTTPSTARRPVRRLLGLLAAQVAAATLVIVYAATGGAMKPDHGLEQLGRLYLAEPVPGLGGTGRAAIVVAPGTGERCQAKLNEAARRRDRSGGIPAEYDVVVLTTATADADAVPQRLRTQLDPAGAITRALALAEALDGCRPGYAVMTADGTVRYRTYDDDWQQHGAVQLTLLRAVD